MRRMRGIAWYSVLFVIPVILLSFALLHFSKKRISFSSFQTLRDRWFSWVFPSPSPASPIPRPVVRVSVVAPVKQPRRELAQKPKSKPPQSTVPEPRATASQSFPAVVESEPEPKPEVLPSVVPVVSLVPVAPVVMVPEVVVDRYCRISEYPGVGSHVATRSEDWERILTQYADVKRELLKWLDFHRSEFAEKTRSFMERQILSVKLKRHPVESDPDLGWRGIGVFSYDGQAPIIRLGSGFSELSETQPSRAKFELARLVIQSVLPCEITRLVGAAEGAEAWAALLSCLQIRESLGCEEGTYSESGWAISSTLAAVVASPGCTLPVFKNSELAKCLKKVAQVPQPSPSVRAVQSPTVRKGAQ